MKTKPDKISGINNKILTNGDLSKMSFRFFNFGLSGRKFSQTSNN